VARKAFSADQPRLSGISPPLLRLARMTAKAEFGRAPVDPRPKAGIPAKPPDAKPGRHQLECVALVCLIS
jgi:hypothetical protein